MKRFFTIMLGVLLIAAVTAPALAWEFAMTGEMEWRYRYFARQGSADLFGSSEFNPCGRGRPAGPRACRPCEQHGAGTGFLSQAGGRADQ